MFNRKGIKSENKWENKRYADIYKECLADGHDVRLLLSGMQDIVLLCLSCERVWKLCYENGSRLWVIGEKDVKTSGLKGAIGKMRCKVLG